MAAHAHARPRSSPTARPAPAPARRARGRPGRAPLRGRRWRRARAGRAADARATAISSARCRAIAGATSAWRCASTSRSASAGDRFARRAGARAGASGSVRARARRSGFVFTKRVQALAAPGALPRAVRFRWPTRTGGSLRTATRTSAVCEQPDLRPDLRPARSAPTRGPQPEHGRATRSRAQRRPHGAPAPFDVTLTVDGAGSRPSACARPRGRRRATTVDLRGAALRARLDAARHARRRGRGRRGQRGRRRRRARLPGRLNALAVRPLHWMTHEDRDPSRVRRGPRPLHLRQRVHTRSTQPEIHVEICSNCHPFYTGRQKLVDTGGRVERFKRRAAKRGARSLGRGHRAATQRLPDGALIAQRDAPVGGQAVLEGVMMRGVSTWAVAVRKPAARGSSPRTALDPEAARHGEIEVTSFPLTSVLKRHRAAAPADRPRRRRAGRVAGHRLQGAGHLRQRAAARGRGGDLRRHVGRHGRRRPGRSPSACSSSSRSG